LNHIYIDIFLMVTHRESLIFNVMTFSVFLFFAFLSPGKILIFRLLVLLTTTKVTILTLAIFGLKFSIDGRSIKDQIFNTFTEQKQLNLQWMGIFKRLPIGILVTKGNKVIHSNKAMLKIIGQDCIEVGSYHV
jgi:hypothetical protein